MSTSSPTTIRLPEPGGSEPSAEGSERRMRTLVGALGVVLAALIWEGATRLEILDPSVVPPLTDVLDALFEEIGSADFWTALWHTCESTLLGLAISVLIALPLGIVLGLNDIAFRSTRFVVEFLKPIPVVAILTVAFRNYRAHRAVPV